jgi:phasin family protein
VQQNGVGEHLPAAWRGELQREFPETADDLTLHWRGNAMYNAAEQFVEINKTNVAQATKLAALAIENAEKLAKVNLLAAKSALAQGVESAQAAAAVKDVQELLALRAKLAEAGVEAAMGYSKSLYDLATEAQAQYTALAEDIWAGYTKGVAAWVEKASASAPAGSDVAVNAFKSTFAASTAAIDQINKATKQVVSLADASVRAAAANATKAAAATKARKAA